MKKKVIEQLVISVRDDVTYKNLVNDKGPWVLRSESTNPKYKDLIMAEEFAIQGMVYDLVRLKDVA